MKRIVEETLDNESIRYRVETNKILGFIPCKWHTDTFYDGERDMTFEAVFDSIDEAYSHIGILRKNSPCEVVSRKIIYYNLDNICGSIGEQTRNAFKKGAQWQKVNLWKDAQGDDLPEIDREVIVLYRPYPCEGNEYAVSFAHRPKEYWDGRNIETDEVTRYYPKRYDKGDWNVPNVRFWLDLELPTQKGE